MDSYDTKTEEKGTNPWISIHHSENDQSTSHLFRNQENAIMGALKEWGGKLYCDQKGTVWYCFIESDGNVTKLEFNPLMRSTKERCILKLPCFNDYYTIGKRR